MNDEKVENLWRWFFQNQDKIKACVEDDSAPERDYIIESLNNFILDLGRFAWEVGLGVNKPWVLTISPNEDKILMKKSKEIIANAPDLADWEFNYCKPAKDWDREFALYDNNMNEQKINASSWKYVATQDVAGMTKLILEAKNIAHLDSETALIAANIVVLNEIGEETKIENISSVAIMGKLDSKYNSKKLDIKELKKKMNVINK